jgi:hypothetical protein
MRVGVQIAFASLLIAAASSLVLLWLWLLTLSYDSQSGLMPWTAAGVIVFGVVVVVIAAIVGVPGIFWANNLARAVQPKWQPIAKAPGWIGTATLVLGFAASIIVLVIALFH